MTALLSEIGPAWAWVIAGLLLAASELMAPGIFLIWLGLAALVTGGVATALAISWQAQILVFAAASVVAVLIGRKLTRKPVSTLNRRGHGLVGKTFVLDTPIAGGSGRLQQGGTTWRIVGPDLPAGTSVTVASLDGTTLVVAPTDAAPPRR